MAKRSLLKFRRLGDWPLWVIVALLIIWGVSQAIRLESQIHGMAHETEGSEQNVQEAQDQSPSAPVVTQAVYLSVQQAGAPEPPPQDNSVTPDVLEVIDPELIAATQNKIEKARELIDQGDIPGA